MNKEFKELQESFAKVQREYHVSKGFIKPDAEAGSYPSPEDPKYQQDRMCAMIDSLARQMNYMYGEMYDYQNKHGKGHLPNMTPGQLSKALDKLGMGDDYEVKKPVIYASRNGQKTLVVEYIKNEKL